ncbi:MAG: ABC transporter ATP-binding protein [Verrucomicrobia bacterium]|nr:ABC transporter ATP-binding protein [Verrucomicrobiota bacterium]
MPRAADSATDEPPPIASQWTLTKRMLALAWLYRGSCLKVLSLQIVLMTIGLCGLNFIGVGVDYLRHAYGRIAGGDAPIPKPPNWPFGLAPPADWTPMQVMATISAAILIFAVARAFLNYAYAVTAGKLVHTRIVVDLRAKVYDKLQHLSFRFFDDNASGAIINRVTGDVQMVRMFVDQVAIQSIILLISLTAYLVYMLHIDAMLTAVCLGTTPLLLVATIWFSRIVKPAYRVGRELIDKLILVITENVQGVHVVKGFARQDDEIKKFKRVNLEVKDQKHWIFRIVSIFQPSIGLLTYINLIILLGYGGILVMRYEQAATMADAVAAGMSIGQLIVFSGLLQQFSGQVASIANIANNMQQSLIGAQRVFEILDAPLEITSRPNPIAPDRMQGHVQFENVTFGFDQAEPVLRAVSLEAATGECVAILGATGAGKSSLLSLIPRFYDPDAGRILIDGIDLRDLDLQTLRRNIGLVFQESFLFSTSVAANIAFGHPDASPAQIEKAAHIAAAHDFIMAMPNGYDTVLKEGGKSLSGGQRQRIAIARAILMEPPILIFDDPTAAIDPMTEEEILGAMENAMTGRTTFLVAHRMSILRRADKIVVLADGAVTQSGTHDELMAIQGEYQRAASIQAPDAESRQLLAKNGDPS